MNDSSSGTDTTNGANTTRDASDTARPSRRRIPAEERRQRLIEAAVELFSRDGFQGTTTRHIAAAADVNEVLLFRDFESKEGLYAAILDYKAKQVGADEWLAELRAVAERKDDEAFIRLLITRTLDSYRSDPQYQRLMFYSSLEGHELSKIFYRTRGLLIFEFLKEYIAQRQKDGVFQPCDPAAAVFAIVGAASYFAIVKYLFGIDSLEVSDEEAAESFTRLALGGLRKNGPGGGSAPAKESERRASGAENR